MKIFIVSIFSAILLSSCLKQSIADAMLYHGHPANVTATLSYEVNGNPAIITVSDAGDQDPNSYYLGCTKAGGYMLNAYNGSDELSFVFNTDSLTLGNYIFTGYNAEWHFLSSSGTEGYARYPTDSMNFNVTSYSQGFISGNFTGRLTPMISASTLGNTYGVPGSLVIRKGIFKNIPVFY